MKIITTHQSSFLPYIGFWYKVINADTFIINEVSKFSLTSMYYRTYMYMNKKDIENNNLNNLTVLIDRANCENLNINEITLKEESIQKLKSQLTSILGLYKNKKLKDIIDIPNFEYLYELNYYLFMYIYNYLELKTKIEINNKNNFYNLDDKTERLINQLDLFNNEKQIYISGSSGKNYADINKFKHSNYDIKFQTELDSDYFHGSILYYILTMSKDEIINFINSKYKLKGE
jgi:hypothetical protein